MLAVLLNPNDELKLIESTKKIAVNLSEGGSGFYTAFPLWCIIDEKNYTSAELKDFSKSITAITLELPVYDGALYSPVKIETLSGKIESRLTLLKQYAKKNTAQELSSDIKEMFPMQLKIFKIANVINLSKNSKAVSDFVWKKL